jgi:hypothetical protein
VDGRASDDAIAELAYCARSPVALQAFRSISDVTRDARPVNSGVRPGSINGLRARSWTLPRVFHVKRGTSLNLRETRDVPRETSLKLTDIAVIWIESLPRYTWSGPRTGRLPTGIAALTRAPPTVCSVQSFPQVPHTPSEPKAAFANSPERLHQAQRARVRHDSSGCCTANKSDDLLIGWRSFQSQLVEEALIPSVSCWRLTDDDHATRPNTSGCCSQC